MPFPSFLRSVKGLALLAALLLCPAASPAQEASVPTPTPSPTPAQINYRTRVTIPLPVKKPTPRPGVPAAGRLRQPTPTPTPHPLLVIPRPTPFGAPPTPVPTPLPPAARPTPFGAQATPTPAPTPVNPLLVIPRVTPFVPKAAPAETPLPARSARSTANASSPTLGATGGTLLDRRPAPIPLYRQYPPEQVVVGEVGKNYILTRRDLDQMTGDVIPPSLLAKQKDEYIALEIQRRRRIAGEDTLQSWAVLKTIAERARMEGLTVTEQEIDARMNQISQEAGGDQPQSGTLQVVGVDQASLRQDMRDGLLADKFILREIDKTFKPADLEARYKLYQERYCVPESVHAWQIVKIIPANLSEKEVADLRKDFYEVRKRAAKNGGKDFEAVAREATDSPIGQKNGGDLGWVDVQSQLPPAVLEAILKLKVGDVSPIIQSQGIAPDVSSKLMSPGAKPRIQVTTGGALHILRVTERAKAQGMTFDDFSRQRVIDDLIAEYKVVRGRQVIQTAPFPVKTNIDGVRLLNAPAP